MGEDGVYLLVQTNHSHLQVADAARTRVFWDGQEISVSRRRIEERGFIAQELEFDQARGEPIVIEKIVALYTSRDHAISECSLEAGKAVRRAGRFEDLLQSHGLAWEGLWSQCDITLEEKQGTQLLLRLHMFHQFEGGARGVRNTWRHTVFGAQRPCHLAFRRPTVGQPIYLVHGV